MSKSDDAEDEFAKLRAANSIKVPIWDIVNSRLDANASTRFRGSVMEVVNPILFEYPDGSVSRKAYVPKALCMTRKLRNVDKVVHYVGIPEFCVGIFNSSDTYNFLSDNRALYSDRHYWFKGSKGVPQTPEFKSLRDVMALTPPVCYSISLTLGFSTKHVIDIDLVLKKDAKISSILNIHEMTILDALNPTKFDFCAFDDEDVLL